MIRHQIRTEYKVQFLARRRRGRSPRPTTTRLLLREADDPDLRFIRPGAAPASHEVGAGFISDSEPRGRATRSEWPQTRRKDHPAPSQVVNPISAFRSKAVKEADDSEDDFAVLGLEPLLSERPLYTDATAGGIALYFAPRPFNLRRGRTRRAFDAVVAWFKEAVPVTTRR